MRRGKEMKTRSEALEEKSSDREKGEQREVEEWEEQTEERIDLEKRR